MRKIPTLFIRDPDNLRYVTRDVHPACEWVMAGEGWPTRKYDGTCMRFDGQRWWARREIKPGKNAPANYIPVETDDVTGKTVGWEPVEQSAFAKHHTEALETGFEGVTELTLPGTFELIGPKVNGNPERYDRHQLVLHGLMSLFDSGQTLSLPRDFDGIAAWLRAHPQWEGIVWHHTDGRMAKIKGRDFPEAHRD